jgi:hypothetical protein
MAQIHRTKTGMRSGKLAEAVDSMCLSVITHMSQDTKAYRLRDLRSFAAAIAGARGAELAETHRHGEAIRVAASPQSEDLRPVDVVGFGDQSARSANVDTGILAESTSGGSSSRT